MSEPVELTRLRQAIDQFKARQPRDLSENVTKALGGLEEALTQHAPTGRDTPGTRAAKEVGYAGGTGVPLREAAKGEDKPSPGQQEAQVAAKPNLSESIKEAAQRIVSEHQASARS